MARTALWSLRLLVALIALALAGLASASPLSAPLPEAGVSKRAPKKLKKKPVPAEDDGDDEDALDREDDEDELDKEPPKAQPIDDIKAVIKAAFMAAREPSEGRGFNNYLDLVHPDQKLTGHAEQQIRRYSWNKFRSGYRQWLTSAKGLDFVIARTDPAKITDKTERVKVFLKAQHSPKAGGPKRFDAPITLQKKGSRWMIWFSSL